MEDLNRAVDGKNHELKQREAALGDCEREITQLKQQLTSFVSELNHLKGLEARYQEENAEIQRRIDAEGNSNVDLAAQIKELEQRIRQKED